jgi:predicted HicB family RNase H-like nuclease
LVYIEYRGYIAEVGYSSEDKVFVGSVVNLQRDILSFHSDTMDDILSEFHSVIDDYIGLVSPPPTLYDQYRTLIVDIIEIFRQI